MTHLHNWAETPTHPDKPSKRGIDGRHADLVRIEVPAGTKAGRHSHPHEQFVQVISGHGILETEEGRKVFSAGSVFHFPAEAWHAAEFDEDTILVEVKVKAG